MLACPELESPRGGVPLHHRAPVPRKRFSRVRVRCCKCRPGPITVPVTAVSRVFTVFSNCIVRAKFIIILLLFNLLYNNLLLLGGKSDNYAKAFMHFWSAHRPFVIIWSVPLTLLTVTPLSQSLLSLTSLLSLGSLSASPLSLVVTSLSASPLSSSPLSLITALVVVTSLSQRHSLVGVTALSSSPLSHRHCSLVVTLSASPRSRRPHLLSPTAI
jgi:hypothetical protein